MPESFRCLVGLDKPEARQHVAKTTMTKNH